MLHQWFDVHNGKKPFLVATTFLTISQELDVRFTI